MKEYRCKLKLVLLGESSVGKSSIVTRFTTGEFHKNQATIGAAFTTKSISWVEKATSNSEEMVQKTLEFEIWDTAGQERYRSLAPMYYRNSEVALVVFNVTERTSFNKATSWIDELKNHIAETNRGDIMIQFVGNKIDLIKPNEILDEWKTMPLVSALTGHGVNELFMNIAKSVPLERFELVKDSQSNPNAVVELLNNTRSESRCNC
ncbi:HBR379Wp [Eremothecium sinecaudum]|uniref:HBR379Wp n=1 Tax=Eremothecium sinecaudum TaxID=45286 RepID=A0A109UXG7_9SACH|nr:HBR379Wp [Eremothecium sinecaudum]AMD19280.1 HBR379Wp [Eremothecium sinecaudum]